MAESVRFRAGPATVRVPLVGQETLRVAGSGAPLLASGTWVQVYRRSMTDLDACTLPTAERPLRLAEFQTLFATALRGQERLSPTHLRWRIDPAAESTARDLTARESECCSFFAF